MKDWEYQELVDALDRSYQRNLDQGTSIYHAIGYTSNDFIFYPEIENVVPNLITLVHTINLRVDKLGKVYAPTLEYFRKQLSLLSEELLDEELKPSEKVLFKQSLYKLQEKLKTAEITLIANPE